MIHTTILPLFGLFGIEYTFRTLSSLTPNKLLLIFLTLIAILFKLPFIDLILPYPNHFNTKNFTTQYLFPLWHKFFSN